MSTIQNLHLNDAYVHEKRVHLLRTSILAAIELKKKKKETEEEQAMNFFFIETEIFSNVYFVKWHETV